jgi:hypothetical protein
LDVKTPHNMAASLMVDIMQVMVNFTRDTMAEASKRFRRRIEAMVAAGGDFFKKIGYVCTNAYNLKIGREYI